MNIQKLRNPLLEEYYSILTLINMLVEKGVLPSPIVASVKDKTPYLKIEPNWKIKAVELFSSRHSNSQKVVILGDLTDDKIKEFESMLVNKFDKLVAECTQYADIFPFAIHPTMISNEVYLSNVSIEYDHATQQFISRLNTDSYFILNAVMSQWSNIILALYGSIIAHRDVSTKIPGLFPTIEPAVDRINNKEWRTPVPVDIDEAETQGLPMIGEVKFNYRYDRAAIAKTKKISILVKYHSWGSFPELMAWRMTDDVITENDILNYIQALKPSRTTSAILLKILQYKRNDTTIITYTHTMQVVLYELVCSILPLHTDNTRVSGIGSIFPVRRDNQYNDLSFAMFTKYSKVFADTGHRILESFKLHDTEFYLTKSSLNSKAKYMKALASRQLDISKTRDKWLATNPTVPKTINDKYAVDKTKANKSWIYPIGLPSVLLTIFSSDSDLSSMPESVLEMVKGTITRDVGGNKTVELTIAKVLLETITERETRLSGSNAFITLPKKYFDLQELFNTSYQNYEDAEKIRKEFLTYYFKSKRKIELVKMTNASEISADMKFNLEKYLGTLSTTPPIETVNILLTLIHD